MRNSVCNVHEILSNFIEYYIGTLDDDSVNQLLANRFTIRVGSSYKYRGGQAHKVKKVFTHPKYTGDHYDVGILQLVDDIKFGKTAQPVQLAGASEQISVGADTFVNGWGTNPDHPRDDNHLYQVHLQVKNSSECARLYGDRDFDAHEICVQGKNKSDCEGDSGGPLIYTKTGRQIGIVSYGGDDCVSNYPTVYTKISDNMDFIDDVKRQTGNKDSTHSTDSHC